MDNTGPYLGQFNTCNNDNNTARSALFYYVTSVDMRILRSGWTEIDRLAPDGYHLLSYMIRVGQANAVAVQKTNFEESRC